MNAHSKPVRLIVADASKVSPAEFARSIGLRTREELQAATEAKIEWYVERILAGCEFSEYGNWQVTEAMKRIALREGDAGVVSDPLKRDAA